MSEATGSRACGSRISWTLRSAAARWHEARRAFDGAACAGAACAVAVPSAPSAVAASGAARSARPWDRARRDEGTEPEASDASRKMPGLLERVLDVAASRLWSRLVCCASTCAIACCNFGGRLPDGHRRTEIGEQRREALLLGRRGLRRDRNRRAFHRRQDIFGRDDRRTVGGASTSASGDRVTASTGSGVAALPDHEPGGSRPWSAIPRAAAPGLPATGFPRARRSRGSQSRSAPDWRRGPQDLRNDHAARRQHEIGRNAANLFGGQHRERRD